MVIVWLNKGDVQTIIQYFKRTKGFLDVMGLSPVPISKLHLDPQNHPEQYINRKGFYSLQVQCIWDLNLFSIHAYVGWPRSVHDTSLLKNSDLWHNGP